MRQTSEAVPLIAFDVDGGAFSGFVGVDGTFVCKGEFNIQMPRQKPSQPTGRGSPTPPGDRPQPVSQAAPSASSSSLQSPAVFRTALSAGKNMTLTDVQDSYNFVRYATELLSQASQAPSSPETTWSAPTEVEQALEWTVKAWDMLTHPPADALFPNRIVPSHARKFDPPTPDDIVIEASVAAGEAVIRAYVLHFDVPRGKAKISPKGVFGKLESTGTIQISGAWYKSLTFTDGSVAAVLTQHEVHVLAPRLACAYRHICYALGELSALRDIVLALDH